MFSDKMTSADSAGSHRSGPHARKKTRRWKRRLLLLVLIVVAGVAFAPQIVAHTSLRNELLVRANPNLAGKLNLGKTSLGWLSPVQVEHLELLHAGGERWGTIENLRSEYTLLDLLLEPSDLGLWKASHCEATVNCEAGTSDVERWLESIQTEEESAPIQFALESQNFLLTLKSAGVESSFDLASARYELSRAGEIAFQFDATPTTTAPGRTPLLSLNTRLDDGMSWKVIAQDFPVQKLEPLLVRFERDERFDANLNGEWSVTREPDHPLQIAGTGSLEELRIDGEAGTLVDAERLELKLDLSQQVTGWHVSVLEGKTGFGQVTLVGEVDLPTTPSWQDTLQRLLDQYFTLNGSVELGELTQQFPALLTLQEGVKLTQGTCEFQIESRPELERRLFTTKLDVNELCAVTPAQAIRWDQPFHANATVSQTQETWKIEDLQVNSKAVSLTGNGTWEKAELNADIDLAAFAAEWGQIFDLSRLQLAGTLKAHAESQVQPSREIKLTGNVTGKNLVLGWGEDRPWELANLKSDLEGTGTISEAGQFGLQEFKGTIHTEKELLTLTRLNPAEDWDSARQHWRISGSGDMTGLAGRFLTRVSSARMLGAYRLETEWLHTDATDQFQNLDLDFNNFEYLAGDFSLAEPQLKITGDLVVEQDSGRITSRELVVNCPTLAARVNDLALVTGPALQVSGKLAARGRIERLWSYIDPSTAQANPTGFLNVQLSALAEADDETRLNWKLTTAELRWPAVTTEIPVNPVSNPGTSPGLTQPVIAPEWTGSGRYLARADQLVIEQSELKSDALSFNLQGQVTALTTSPVATIEGVCQYNWEQLLQRYPGLLGDDLKLYGAHQSPVKLTVPLTRTEKDRDQMAGSVAVAWDRGEWHSLPIGAGTLAVDLSPQRMVVRPVEVTLAGGAAKFGPTIERTSQGAILLQQPELLLDRVQLTDEICHEWLRYVSPLTADAARVRGSFSVDNTKVLQVPLDNWQQMTGEGIVQIHTAEMRPGPLAMQFITLSKQIEALRRGTPFDPQAVDPDEPMMTITRQTIPCKVENGRVHHKDLTIVVRDLSITSSGSVGFDDTIDLVANIEIPDKWKIRGKPVREIWGASIQIPIRGSLSRPQMDPRVIQTLMDRLVRGTVTNFLEEELNKQLNKLFQPK